MLVDKSIITTNEFAGLNKIVVLKALLHRQKNLLKKGVRSAGETVSSQYSKNKLPQDVKPL